MHGVTLLYCRCAFEKMSRDFVHAPVQTRPRIGTKSRRVRYSTLYNVPKTRLGRVKYKTSHVENCVERKL